MIQLIFAAIFVVGAVAEDAKSEPSIVRSSLHHEYLGSGAERLKTSKDYYNEHEPEFTEQEKKIIQNVYSPDYYEPNVILDYRYLKTGGRGYARSDGGQILILPRRNHMPAMYNNYDTLLEYLRLKHLEETNRDYKLDSQKYANEPSERKETIMEPEKEHAEEKSHNTETKRAKVKYNSKS